MGHLLVVSQTRDYKQVTSILETVRVWGCVGHNGLGYLSVPFTSTSWSATSLDLNWICRRIQKVGRRMNYELYVDVVVCLNQGDFTNTRPPLVISGHLEFSISMSYLSISRCA